MVRRHPHRGAARVLQGPDQGHARLREPCRRRHGLLPRNNIQQQEACRTLVESEILRFGYAIRGWRQVPVDTSVIGEKAAATRPEIEQIIIGNPQDRDDEHFERDLYVIRRRIERLALAENITEFYICSMSCRSIIYKGLFLAEQLAIFYPDLQDERFVSSFAIFHQRYSTNTWPAWKLAQPFRTLAHNGEINTLRGNVNWMKSHETRHRDRPRSSAPIRGLEAGHSDRQLR